MKTRRHEKISKPNGIIFTRKKQLRVGRGNDEHNSTEIEISDNKENILNHELGNNGWSLQWFHNWCDHENSEILSCVYE